jgi:hypothetical protein
VVRRVPRHRCERSAVHGLSSRAREARGVAVSEQQPSQLARILAAVRGVDVHQVVAEMNAPSAWEPARSPSQAELRAEQAKLSALGASSLAPLDAPSSKRRGLDPSAHLGTREGWDRGVPHFAPLDWLRADFARAAALQRSAAACRKTLAQLPPRFARRVKLAALACIVRDGVVVPTRSMEHVSARCIVALAVTVWHASRNTARDGHGRVLVGRARGSFCTLLRNPLTSEPYSIARLYATSHHGTDDPWDCGHMVALDRAGAFAKHQPPASTSPRAFVGRARDGSLRALNQYWLSELLCERDGSRDVDCDECIDALVALVAHAVEPPS